MLFLIMMSLCFRNPLVTVLTSILKQLLSCSATIFINIARSVNGYNTFVNFLNFLIFLCILDASYTLYLLPRPYTLFSQYISNH